MNSKEQVTTIAQKLSSIGYELIGASQHSGDIILSFYNEEKHLHKCYSVVDGVVQPTFAIFLEME